MRDFREEEELGKAYDSKLMKRLLSYAKPYWKILLLCIVLLLIVTGVELARPYLIQRAIDDHINVQNIPQVSFPDSPSEEVDYLEIDGNYLVRQNQLEEEYPDLERHQFIRYEGHYFLVPTFTDNPERVEITGEPDNFTAIIGEENYPARSLTSEEIAELREEDFAGITRIALFLLSIMIAGFIFHYLEVFLLHKTSQQIIYNMRQEIFSHLQQMSLAYFDKNPVGRLVTRVTNDTETLNDMYSQVIVTLFKDIFMLGGIIIIMLALNVELTLITFAIMPLVIVVSIIFRYFAREAYRKVRVRLAKINATISENISGIEIIQIFNQQRRKFKEFSNINEDYYDATMRHILVYAIFRPAMDLLYSLALAILIWYGGGRVLQSTLSFGVLYAFTDYIRRFFQPINDLTEKYNTLQSAMASAERIFKILDTEEEIADPEEPLPLPAKLTGKVKFEEVWFSYDEEEWVLKDINLTIKPGETVALVGATGAGKSSLIKLLSRFYDVQQGKITVDGKDIRSYPRRELRQHIGVVLQEVFLFTGTIAENISLHRQDISQEEIIQAAKYVNAHKFISRLKNGYEHEVQERGSTFSAGEKQLIAFARTLAFDPDILVLDEATSNIDTETELLIQDALYKLTENRTTIVIAHRLSTIQHADRIVVMHKGKIREMGDHQELLDKGGIYYDLYQLQYKDQLLPEENQKEKKTS